MAWLVFGQAYDVVEEVVPRRISVFLKGETHKKKIVRQVLSWVSFVVLYSAPALGGMVTVGKMIKEYGSCNLAD